MISYPGDAMKSVFGEGAGQLLCIKMRFLGEVMLIETRKIGIFTNFPVQTQS